MQFGEISEYFICSFMHFFVLFVRFTSSKQVMFLAWCTQIILTKVQFVVNQLAVYWYFLLQMNSLLDNDNPYPV